MMDFMDNALYAEDVKQTAALPLDWDKLNSSVLLLAGASGMIGGFLTDVFMYRNQHRGQKLKVLALGRDQRQGEERFKRYRGHEEFAFIPCDINSGVHGIEAADYVIQAASNTHPMAYASDPIGTVRSNIVGTDHLLEYAAQAGARRFVFLSSVEIYGQNRGDTEKFKEDYCGYINSNTLRAGYPEGKRAGEALCQAYRRQKNLDYVIPRLARTYGPNMRMDDSKAAAQFIKKGAAGEDIVLKSQGKQLYTHTYVADAAAGVLTVMLKGESGEAYNVAGDGGHITLGELARFIAADCGTKVVFEIPGDTEQAGYSKAQKALLDGSKLEELGYQERYSVKEGVRRTISILKQLKSRGEKDLEMAE
ncbi:NAD-dependent epimerase/dehydratase family protein [Luxibacter massiliensis]|uniref:NAD-dependent epimerase/dehydratase family protein n=1 Tax=Luxibacter massiliensis TaxID=2219695 RepID=UPI00197D43C6|nr:NAD-dependent epimerase/dehydratase family protein [Luxibacter massiliensis]